MPYLYELIQQKVIDWRRHGYPAMAEILDYATLPESAGLRYLRQNCVCWRCRNRAISQE
ncbi:MAG: hypothetical protein P8186_07105 [Anaerolineae bacterium]